MTKTDSPAHAPKGLTADREAQAHREVGRTAVARLGSWWLSLVFLALVGTVPAVDLALRAEVRGAFGELVARAGQAVDGLLGRPLAANRRLLAGMVAFEDALEERSILRERLLPPVQLVVGRTLGLGNEQAYLGRGAWLFYRADLEHLIGRPFLDRRAQELRAQEASEPGTAVVADPLPALRAFARDLEARGIRLLVLPTPVKPTLAATHFSRRYDGSSLPRNPSAAAFRERLRAAGIAVLDPVPLLADAKRRAGAPQYLATDTHWRPEAMERVAVALARRVESEAALSEPALAGYTERRATVEAVGDIAVMLKLPRGQTWIAPEEATIRPVLTWEGGLWRPAADAEVLLLGDSFTNVFSDPGLGWGAGGGLAERLAFHLQRPVDRIARNAGGSHVTRRILADQLARDPARLDAVRLVVYQFAVRELSQGHWPRIRLPRG